MLEVVVLFMLGIVATFNNLTTKIVVTIVSAAALIFGVISMLGVPMITL